MPPRIPAVFLFVACYFAVVWGGGASAPAREALVISFSGLPAWFDSWFGLPGLRLAFGDLLALAAAAAALPDAGLRGCRSAVERLISVLCALIAAGALAIEPLMATPGYAILLALSCGDALAALGSAFVRPAAPRPYSS